MHDIVLKHQEGEDLISCVAFPVFLEFMILSYNRTGQKERTKSVVEHSMFLECIISSCNTRKERTE